MQEKLKLLGDLGIFEVSDYIYQKERYNSFIYPSVCNGKIVKLFKVLLSNNCVYNCLYCANRKDRDCPRYSFSPCQLSEIFYNIWRKKTIIFFHLQEFIKLKKKYKKKMI